MAKMNRERGSSNVDELASEFDFLIGRRSFASNSEGESSSLNHMEEEQRSMLRSRHHPQASTSGHHPQASSSRLPALDQHTNHSSSATYPPGSRFLPTDLALVSVYLKDMAEKGKQSSFITITTLDVYEDDPWLLRHVHNDLFKRNKWYYFVPRIKRGGKSCKRTVPARGESEGGTWKSNNKKKEITDKDNKVEGYKQKLVYNKTVNGKPEPTDWRMTEYSLPKGIRDDLVLCYIRLKLKKKDKDITERSKNRRGRALTYEGKGKAKMVYEDEQPSRISSILWPNKSPVLFKAQRSSPQAALKGQIRTKASTQAANDFTGFANQEEMLQGEASTEAANDFTGFANQIYDDNIMWTCEDMSFYLPGPDEDFMADLDELINTEGDSTQQQPVFQDEDLG